MPRKGKRRTLRSGRRLDLPRAESREVIEHYEHIDQLTITSIADRLVDAGNRLSSTAATWRRLDSSDPEQLVGMLLDLSLAHFELWEIAEDTKLAQAGLLSRRMPKEPAALQGLLLARMICPAGHAMGTHKPKHGRSGSSRDRRA